jgi:ubiquitin conjugation factor E4 B
MSDTQPELSDAEKMRLKRLARLGGAATTTPSAPPPAADHPAEQHQPQPGPSASSRLLNSTPAQSTSTPKSAPKASTSTPPVTRPVKRPSPTSVRAEPAAAPAIRKPAPPARLPVPYPEWEAQRIQGIFSVTLSVGPTLRQLLTTAR